MKVCLCGRTERLEFAAVVRDAESIVARAGGELLRARSVAELTRDVAALRDVDFFLLLRSYPSEFTARELEPLRNAAPLAPFAIVAGELCEGEDRIGERFPGARRRYVREWRDSWRAEFERFCDPRGAQGLFTLPATASTVDILLAREVYNAPTSELVDRFALVVADDAGSLTSLSRTLTSAGYQTRTWRTSPTLGGSTPTFEEGFNPSVVVVDLCVDLTAPETVAALARVRTRFRSALLALLTFAPRREEFEFFTDVARWGRARVFGKPFDVESFLAALESNEENLLTS